MFFLMQGVKRREVGTHSSPPYLLIPNRRHPSRLLVFNRSRIWKKGIGEFDPVAGGSGWIVASTFSTDQGSEILGVMTVAGSRGVFGSAWHLYFPIQVWSFRFHIAHTKGFLANMSGAG